MDVGEIRYVSIEDCEYYLNPMKQAMNALNRFGRGLSLADLISDSKEGMPMQNKP